MAENSHPQVPNILPPVGLGVKWVSIMVDNTSPQVRKELHCFNCGRIVANYYSEVRMIIVGEVREASRPFDVMCSRCKTMHRII